MDQDEYQNTILQFLQKLSDPWRMLLLTRLNFFEVARGKKYEIACAGLVH